AGNVEVSGESLGRVDVFGSEGTAGAVVPVVARARCSLLMLSEGLEDAGDVDDVAAGALGVDEHPRLELDYPLGGRLGAAGPPEVPGDLVGVDGLELPAG